MIGWLLNQVGAARSRFRHTYPTWPWMDLQRRGLRIGPDVYLPESTHIDPEYPELIEIESGCGFGPGCMILAHSDEPVPTCGVRRVGPVRIRASCHVGARSVILPGVELGPRTIVAANSVVTSDLPGDALCAGNPARVLKTLDEYLDGHRQRIATARQFPFTEYDLPALDEARRAEVVAAVDAGVAYIVGGRTAELRGEGGSERTGGVS